MEKLTILIIISFSNLTIFQNYFLRSATEVLDVEVVVVEVGLLI